MKEKCVIASEEEIKVISRVTKYLVRLTIDLMKTHGTLPDPAKWQGNKLSSTVVNDVIEHTRLCCSKKDYVSVSGKLYK